jgi:hypothetical protein
VETLARAFRYQRLLDEGRYQLVMVCTEFRVALATVKGELRSGLMGATGALARGCVEPCAEGANTPALPFAA